MMRLLRLALITLLLGCAAVGASTNPPPPCGNPPKPPPPSNCTHNASSNPFDIYSGSVGREVIDLEPAHSVGEAPLRFARYHASRWDVNPGFDIASEKPFGDGGNWRHRFLWTVLDNGTNSAGQTSIRIIYPYGFYGNFAKADSNATHLTYLASTHERVLEESTNYFLIMLDGTRYHFTGWTNEAGRFYRMEGFFDPYSNRYQFVYTAGHLSVVIGPNTNLYLGFTYTTLTNSQPPGDIQFTFTDGSATQVLLVGTFNGWTGQAMTNSAGLWSRIVTLTNGIYEYKFIARYAGQTNDFWYSDPDNPLYTLPNSNSVALIQSNDWTSTLLASVQGTDNRVVSYQYGQIWGTGIVHVVLTNAAYGDGTCAAYTYYHPSEDLGRRPLLKTADDPMYRGPAGAVRYVYQSDNIYPGQIYEERHLYTDQLLARLEMDGNNPLWRRVTKSDGATEDFNFGTNTGQRLAYTNAVGYSYRSEYYMAGDAEGMLWKEVDPMCRTTTYSRTWDFGAVTMASNNILGVRQHIYTSNAEPFYLSAEIDEAGRTNAYTRDSCHRITRHDYPDGSYETFTYNDHGQILTHRRRDGGEWSSEYDERGRKMLETDPTDATTTFGYDECDRLTATTNALGYVTRHFYNWRGLVTNVVYADGTGEKTWYDHYGQPTQRLDHAGGVWVSVYDDLGNLSVARDPLNHEISYQHDVEGRIVTSSNAVGLVISNAYDGIGRKVRETYSTDSTYREWRYDPDGVRTQFNRLSMPSAFAYTPEGWLQSVADPLGRATSYGYDKSGNRTHITNAIGDVAIQTYDPAGRITSTRDCFGAVVSNVYDSGGRLVSRTDSNGITNEFIYDGAGRLLTAWRDEFLLQSNAYNAFGWLTVSVDANGLARSNTYDAVGRLLRIYLPDDSFSENVYSNTFLVESVDHAGRHVFFQHDVLGRVTNQIDNAGHIVRFAYDAAGSLTYLWDQNGNLTRFVYDSEGRQTAKIHADDSQYTYTYDAESRLTSKLDAKNRTTAYLYDAVGNLTNIVFTSDPPVAFSYDFLNRMTRIADGIGTTLWTYAAGCGAVESVDGPFDNDTLFYSHDLGNRLLSVTSALSAVSYSYDFLDRVTNVVSGGGPPTARYIYLANGRLPSEFLRGNGTRTRYEYDLLNRLTNLVHETDADEVLSSYAYTLNSADERIAVTIGGPGTPRTINYAYDAIGQLTGAESEQPGYSFNYSYDPAGNPVLQDNNDFVFTNVFNNLNQHTSNAWSGSLTVLGTVNITNGTVSVNGYPAQILASGTFVATNLLVVSGSNIFTAILTDPFGRASTSRVSAIAQDRGFAYDPNGNLTNDSQFAYVWDDADRLKEVRSLESGQPVMNCRYDGLGRRRERVVWNNGAGSTNHYIYNSWLVLAVLDGSTNVLETYTHGPDLSGTIDGAGGIGGIIACEDAGQWSYFHCDGNGNVVTITDTNQNIVTSIEYGPFGALMTHSGSYQPRYRFSSKEWDELVGLYYYGYRYYCPEIGRWLSRDPIEEEGGENLYSAIHNNPVNSGDILGLITYSYISRGSYGATTPNFAPPQCAKQDPCEWILNGGTANPHIDVYDTATYKVRGSDGRLYEATCTRSAAGKAATRAHEEAHAAAARAAVATANATAGLPQTFPSEQQCMNRLAAIIGAWNKFVNDAWANQMAHGPGAPQPTPQTFDEENAAGNCTFRPI
ncbi:MAG: RHS repeat-associated core domain-containing protein [bacterium]